MPALNEYARFQRTERCNFPVTGTHSLHVADVQGRVQFYSQGIRRRELIC